MKSKTQTREIGAIASIILAAASHVKSCYIWPARLWKDGKPAFTANNDTIPDVRLYLYNWYHESPLPRTHETFMTCENSKCINPQHIEDLTSWFTRNPMTSPEFQEELTAAQKDLDHWHPADRQFRQVPRALRIKVLNRDSHECVYCGSVLNLVMEHYMPYSRGGRETLQNILTACRSCNTKIGARRPADKPLPRYGRFRPT